jgi:hypothetical protein
MKPVSWSIATGGWDIKFCSYVNPGDHICADKLSHKYDTSLTPHASLNLVWNTCKVETVRCRIFMFYSFMYGLQNNAVRSSENVASNVKVIWRNVAGIGHVLCNLKCYLFFTEGVLLCVYKPQTNHSSFKHNHVFYSGRTTCFGLKRP